MAKTINFEPQSVKINRHPYVLLPLKTWEDFQDYYEMYLEQNSPKLRKEIAQARQEIKDGKYITLEAYDNKRKSK